MSATKLVMNWGPVTFASQTFLKITAAAFGHGGQLIAFSGDLDIFPTTIVNNMNNPHFSFTTGDVGTIESLIAGTQGTLVAQLNDAKLAMGGAVVYTATNTCVLENVDTSGAHAQYGTGTVTFQFFSVDGVTNPVVISRV